MESRRTAERRRNRRRWEPVTAPAPPCSEQLAHPHAGYRAVPARRRPENTPMRLTQATRTTASRSPARPAGARRALHPRAITRWPRRTRPTACTRRRAGSAGRGRRASTATTSRRMADHGAGQLGDRVTDHAKSRRRAPTTRAQRRRTASPPAFGSPQPADDPATDRPRRASHPAAGPSQPTGPPDASRSVRRPGATGSPWPSARTRHTQHHHNRLPPPGDGRSTRRRAWRGGHLGG
jgi:hypothetical protein